MGFSGSYSDMTDMISHYETRNDSTLRQYALREGVDGIGHAGMEPPAHGERH
jgi:hypothetical protein